MSRGCVVTNEKSVKTQVGIVSHDHGILLFLLLYRSSETVHAVFVCSRWRQYVNVFAIPRQFRN